MPVFTPPQRLLMGPGPSDVAPSVLEAMAQPAIGHLDSAFTAMMEEIKEMLRYAFQTENAMTFPVSAPGSLGMEMALVNLLEPGDKAIIAQNGVFGGRMKSIVERSGATAVLLETEWGRPVDLETLEAAVKAHPDARLIGFVHAETSTGARSDAAAIGALAQRAGMLTVMDAVTSLGGIPVRLDEWGIDVTYSGSQKCLSVPPGLSPVSFSDRAIERIKARSSEVQSWFCDLNLLLGYWQAGSGGARSYHHTAPVNALYGLHEGLSLLTGEGLEAAWVRHASTHRSLAKGLEALGLTFLVAKECRLPQLNTVHIPKGADDGKIRTALLENHGIEIGAGLGPFAGKVWRIGLMGESCREENVSRLLSALEIELGRNSA